MNDLKKEQAPLIIKNSQVFDILVNGERVHLLAPFLTQARTVSAAAKMSGQSAKKMGYWVERFVEYGLLQQVSPANGRQGATYQVTAQHFVIEDLDVLLVSDYIKQQLNPLWETFIDSVCVDSGKYSDRWDFHCFSDNSGNLVRDLAPSWERAAYLYDPQRVTGHAVNSWALLSLTRSDAQDFMNKLKQLMTEYVGKAGPEQETRRYLVHLGLARVDHE